MKVPISAPVPLIRAPFRGRPNRFIVRFGPPGGGDGPLGTAYLANPGRLGEILLAGADVLVEQKPHTKIGWEAVGAAWEARWPGDRPRAVFPIRAPAAGECDLAADLRGIAEVVEDFGSTDCGCPGHLVRFAEDPFRTAPFQRVLIGWRHQPSIRS